MKSFSTDIDIERLRRVADIVVAYLEGNRLHLTDLPSLISDVGRTFHEMEATPTVRGEPKPDAAQIRRSIKPDALTSFVDGKPYKSLKRHLRSHGLDMEGYRKRYGLPIDYPSIAVNYSRERAARARGLGLGRKPRQMASVHVLAELRRPMIEAAK